jgi:hypothetical protein
VCVLLVLHAGGLAAWGQSHQVELVLEQNPPEGGMVNPGSGVHHYASDSHITVSAVPQPGYRFAYWLGDVSDPGSSTTQISLNDSKAVVAVFERVVPNSLPEDEEEEKWLTAGGGGGGGAGLSPSRPDFFTTSWSISGGAAPQAPVISGPVFVQTPEPATFLLLGLGGTLLARRPRNRNHRRTV